jgi:DNA-binding response OmpR family regulator
MNFSQLAAERTVQPPHSAGKVMHTGFSFTRAVRQMHIGLRGRFVNTGSMAATRPEHALANILIIEDDPQQVWFYSKTLRGYRLTCVPNATAALSEIKRKPPDLIILDHVLTGGELGVSFLPQIKALAAHVPIIIISGTLDVQGKLAALQGPRAAHYVIEKPVDLGELEKAVEIALTECGFAEMVSMLESLERAEGPATSEPEHQFTARLARQHKLLLELRNTGTKPNITNLSAEYGVARKTIIRDLQDLIRRGQLDPAVYPEQESPR